MEQSGGKLRRADPGGDGIARQREDERAAKTLRFLMFNLVTTSRTTFSVPLFVFA